MLFWIIRATTMFVAKGWINTPPPIVSRIYQELSNGMNGYMDACAALVTSLGFRVN